MISRLVPLLLFLIVAITLILVVDDFIQQVIVKPVLYVAWLIALLVDSIPQAIFWALFIITALIVAARSITREKSVKPRTQMRATNHRGPVANWSILLERAEAQDFSRWRLAQALRNLTAEILVSRMDIELLQRAGNQESSTPDLPPEIAAYYRAQVPRSQGLSRFWFRRQGSRPATALDIDPETVVTFLENELDPLIGAKYVDGNQ